MKSVSTTRVWLCLLPLLLHGMLACAHALTLNFKSVKLNAAHRASLQRFLTDTAPDLSFDWNSLEAHSHSMGRERQQLSATLNTVPALTGTGVCRREQHHFYVESGKKRWQANSGLTSLQAWAPSGGDCAAVTSPISVDKTLSDVEFLFIDRERDALRSRAAQVIGGSDCARVRYCEVTLRRISRVREESPTRNARIFTKLTFTPLKLGPACLYVMEVSFVGPLNDLVPLGASCPLP